MIRAGSGRSTVPLIAVELHGRLGNQLFQYALVRARIDPDDPVLVEVLAAPDHLDGALRPGRHRPLTATESLSLRRPPSFPGPGRRVADGLVRRLPGGGATGLLGRHLAVDPSDGRFDPALATRAAPVLFRGYFQHEAYFIDRADEVAASLVAPSTTVEERWRALTASDGSSDTVAVVVRAGTDYARIGWDLTYDWYVDAATSVATRLGTVRFAVFSDVPFAADALAERLDDIGPATSVVGPTPVEQLHLIARCDHAVVAASSFAWWGAWLGDVRVGFDAGRIVVAPEPWIVDGSDTAPDRWASLPARTRRVPDPPGRR